MTKKNSYKLLRTTVQKNLTKNDILFIKHKKKLQAAYVLQLNAIVYKNPHFDSGQIHYISSGERIIVSKKIYYPLNRFGSFYKVYVQKPRKIVGYISEVDVIPRFIKENKKYVLNSKFTIAERHKGNMNKVAEQSESRPSKEKSFSYNRRKNKNRFVGVSLAFPANGQSFVFLPQLGIRLSGYNLLISNFNMDFNISSGLIKPVQIKIDVLGVYDKIKLIQRFPLLAGAGFRVNIDAPPIPDQTNNILSGIGSLGTRIPITYFIFLTANLRVNFPLPFLSQKNNSKGFQFEALASLQIPF